MNPFALNIDGVSLLRIRISGIAIAVLTLGLAACGGDSGAAPSGPQSVRPADPDCQFSSPCDSADTVSDSAGTQPRFVPAPPTSSPDLSPGDSCFEPTLYGMRIRSGCDVSWFEFPDEDAVFAMSSLDYLLDVEPNDDLQTASLVPIDFVSMDSSKTSIGTVSTLSADTDRVDNYVFTTTRAGWIGIELCVDNRPPCGQWTEESNLDVAIAHVEILNQFGEQLATTALGGGAGNFVALEVDSGLPYYVSVVGGALPATQNYYLRFTQLESPPVAEPEDPRLVRPEAPQLTLSMGGVMIVTIDWTAPSLNSDSTALTDLQGYVLYYGNAQGGPYPFYERLPLGLSSYTLSLPDYGEWYYAITAVNSAGVESDFSNEVVHVDLPPPMP